MIIVRLVHLVHEGATLAGALNGLATDKRVGDGRLLQGYVNLLLCACART
jgi:hypothetical protein